MWELIQKNTDACQDFFMLVLSAHILVASMEVLGMQAVTDIPSETLIPSDVLEKNKEEKTQVLRHVVSIMIDTYVNISTVKYKAATPADSSSDKGESHHDTNSNLKDSVVEDEESDVDFEVAEDPDIEVDGSGGDKCEKSPKKDDVFRYACELLTLGLICNEYSDAIKEGDGKRVFRCFKYMLPLFKASNRVNYSCEMFCTLAQHNSSSYCHHG